MSVPGFSEVECGCGCENLIPLSCSERGWRYLRGHKPKAERPLGGGVMRKPREKAAPVAQASYALTLEMVKENRAGIESHRDALAVEWAAACETVDRLNQQMTACDVAVAKLRAAEDALESLARDGAAATVPVEHDELQQDCACRGAGKGYTYHSEESCGVAALGVSA